MEKLFTASSPGFGGPVSVTISVDDGRIISVNAAGEKETPNISAPAFNKLPAAILAAGNTDVDAVTGATVTSNAILRAADSALEQAGMLPPPAPVNMLPGTYKASAYGYDAVYPIEVNVTVSEKAIESIEIANPDDIYDDAPIFASARDLLIPRIIDAQSVTVDAVTGATASSAGITMAVEKALQQALDAGSSPRSAMRNFYKSSAPSGKTVELERDIVVAGMGGAGCAAAMSAMETVRELGLDLKVLALDSAGKFGGTAAVCGELFAMNPPEYIARYNNGEDYCDRDSLWHDWIDVFTRGKCKEDLVKLLFDESGKTVDWLSFKHGFNLHSAKQGFGDDSPWRVKYQYIFESNLEEGRDYGPDFVPASRPDNVDGYFRHIISDYTAIGGEYMLETECYELLYDKENSRVAGLKARGGDGTEYIIRAKAVILAGGGFGGSGEMEKKYLSNDFFPLNGEWRLHGMAQNKGQLIDSAIENGADVFNIGMAPCIHLEDSDGRSHKFPRHLSDVKVRFSRRFSSWSADDLPAVIGAMKSVMHFGDDGRRHYNEAGTFQFWKCGPHHYTLAGSELLSTIAEKGIAGPENQIAKYSPLHDGGYPYNKPAPEVYKTLDAAVEAGFAFRGETLQELARAIGIPEDAFVEEVAKYNAFCAEGVDKDFGKNAANLPITALTGPFYAVRCRPLVYATAAGLNVDTNVNVLDRSGNVMQGLYACGNDSGGVLYAPDEAYARYGGVALGWAFTSGRLAGINAVNYISKQK